MRLSTDNILTTHVGSLPRPENLRAMIAAQVGGDPIDRAAFDAACDAAVAEMVAKQIECGVDIVGDGEMSKISYVGYVKDRMRGIEYLPPPSADTMSAVLPTAIGFPDLADHSDYASFRAKQGSTTAAVPVCTGPLAYGDGAPLKADLARLAQASKHVTPADTFVNAASPGVLALFISNQHYASEDAYLADLTAAMQREYEAIVASGRLLQIDAPDLAMSWHMRHWRKGESAFLKIAQRNVEAINAATANIPAEAIRLHICWGNYAGPHTYDIPVSTLFPVLFAARAQAISFEGANPRHAHEWEDWAAAKIPDDKVLLPGVIDSTTNIVEHPRLVAQRIQRYASIVGRERVIASTDCGFGTFALRAHNVFPSVVWSKLKALAEGARLASAALWKRA